MTTINTIFISSLLQDVSLSLHDILLILQTIGYLFKKRLEKFHSLFSTRTQEKRLCEESHYQFTTVNARLLQNQLLLDLTNLSL